MRADAKLGEYNTWNVSGESNENTWIESNAYD